MRDTILNVFNNVFVEFGFGEEPPVLCHDTKLLECGMDSMGFAILVSTLESELGFDPFSIVEVPVYPVTFGEFVEFYESNKP